MCRNDDYNFILIVIMEDLFQLKSDSLDDVTMNKNMF